MSEPSERFGGFTSTTELPGAGRDVGSPLRRLRSMFGSQSAALFLVLVVLAVFFSTLRPDAFPKIANIINMATNASVLLVLGVGSTFVILTGGIDLSINGVLVFSGVIAAMAMVAVGGDNPAVLLVGLVGGVAAGTAWGMMNGFLVAKAKIPPLIVTLGTMGMSLGLALLLTRGVDISDVPERLMLTVGSGRHPDSCNHNCRSFRCRDARAGIYAIRSVHICRRIKPRSVPAGQHRRDGSPNQGLYAGRYAFGPGGLPLPGQVRHDHPQWPRDRQSAGDCWRCNRRHESLRRLGGMMGTLIGTIIPVMLLDGFVVLGLPPFWQQVAVGAVLIVAVYFDQLRRSLRNR